MRRVLVLFTLIVFLVSCGDDVVDDCCFSYDTTMWLSLKSEEGTDLLDPATEAYNFNDFRLYYLSGDEKIEVYDGNLDLPRDMDLVEFEDEYRLKFFAQDAANEEGIVDMFLSWNNEEEEVIKCELDSRSNGVSIMKVWINDDLVWDVDNVSSDRYFTLIK